MKIYFFILGGKNSTTTYSNKLFANELKRLGYDIEIVEDYNTKLKILDKPECNAIFFQKTVQCKAHTKEYIEHLKGKVNLIHIDDDYQNMKDKEHIETLNISDLILVGTHLHKRKLKQHYTSTPVEVISCMLDFAKYKYVPIKEKNNDQVIISWQQSCADAYVDDILLIAQVLNNLVKSYGVKIHLYGWHMGKDYKDNRSVVKEVLPSAKFIKYEPMERYIKNIVPQISKSDIFIMPYINSPYRWGKSGFGLKRMMLLGIPVVVSSTQHHNTMIKNGVNGFTASNNKEWYYYLEKLIKDKSLREIFSINGRKSMEKEFNNEKVIKQFIKMVNKHLDVF